MTKRVLISGEIANPGIEYLIYRGYEVDCKPALDTHELKEIIADYDALIIRSATKVTAEVIESAKRLKIIGRAGVGVDNIDVDAASNRGIIVCNVPTSNIISVAEHTMALLLTAARNVVQADASMKAGKWERSSFMGVELYNKTLAIFGLGRVGGLVAKRAAAFGMNLVAYDPYCSSERAESLGVKLYDTIEEILPIADFITVHLPKTEETIRMFGPEQYVAMKDGVILVNVARSEIHTIDSLADFMAAGKIAACGIDAWEVEPCTDSPLHEFDNAILTPSLGAFTKEAQMRASVQIAEFVASGLEGSIVPTAINMTSVPPEVMDLLGPYVPACQFMGLILSQISEGELPALLQVTAAGALAGLDLSMLSAGALEGFLSYQRKAVVTPVNALTVARRHGIRMETLSKADAQEYASSVVVNADGKEIACTLAGITQKPRIVSFMGYQCDITPGQHVLIAEYDDRPGKIGIVGTILGESNINISTMQIATKTEEETAMMFVNVSSELDEGIMGKLKASTEFKNLWYVRL